MGQVPHGEHGLVVRRLGGDTANDRVGDPGASADVEV
jgi:hypothetical protein